LLPLFLPQIIAPVDKIKLSFPHPAKVKVHKVHTKEPLFSAISYKKCWIAVGDFQASKNSGDKRGSSQERNV